MSTQERGVIYSAVGLEAIQKACKSGRSVRLRNSQAEFGLLLVTDSRGKSQTVQWSSLVFDSVVETGQPTYLRWEESNRDEVTTRKTQWSRKFYEGECGPEDGTCMLDWKNEHESRPMVVKRHMHTLKIRAMMIGLHIYHKILFLDVETIVCESLHSLFRAVDSQGPQVAFVPVSKGHFYGGDIVARVFDIPTDFPEVRVETMVFQPAV